MTHGLSDAIERHILFLPEPDKHESFRRYLALSVIEQNLVRFTFELPGVNQIPQRPTQHLVKRGRIHLGQSVSFTMGEDENFCRFRLRSSRFRLDSHDVHSLLLVQAVSRNP